MKQLILMLTLVVMSCSNGEQYSSINFGILPNDEMVFQKMIIGQLTGHQEITTAKGKSVRLKSRWNQKERSITLNYLESLFDQLDLESYRHHYKMPNSNFAVDLLIEPLKGTNIYTVLPSTNNSDEYIVIGAHYDTDGEGFPGAIDNGSGMALITSVLRQATQIEHRNRNLMVVYFDQEEENISAGSLSFAKFLKSHEYDIHSVHSFDLIGWDSDDNKEVQLELPKPNPIIEGAYLKHADELNIPIYSIRANASDYSSFYKMDINTIGISQAFTKGDFSGKKDSPQDEYQIVNFEYLASATTLAFAVIKDLLKSKSDE